MNDTLARKLARMNADLAPEDEVPMHAANTAFLRQDPTYFPRWVAHEVKEGRPPATEAMVEASTFLEDPEGR